MAYFLKFKFKTFGKNLNLKLNYIQPKKNAKLSAGWSNRNPSGIFFLLFILFFFLFILLVGRQPALLVFLNTNSEQICVCVYQHLYMERWWLFFRPIHRYRPGTRTRDAQHICSHHNADALNHSTTRTSRF